MGEEGTRPVRILLVEEHPGDVRLIEEHFRDAHIANDLAVVPRGQDAIDHLQRRGPDAERPDIVLTGSQLPDVDVADVIAAASGDAAVDDVPVVVLTGGATDPDVLGAEAADGVLQKPLDVAEFVELCRSVGAFWIQIVDSPPEE